MQKEKDLLTDTLEASDSLFKEVGKMIEELDGYEEEKEKQTLKKLDYKEIEEAIKRSKNGTGDNIDGALHYLKINEAQFGLYYSEAEYIKKKFSLTSEDVKYILKAYTSYANEKGWI